MFEISMLLPVQYHLLLTLRETMPKQSKNFEDFQMLLKIINDLLLEVVIC